MKGLLFQRTKDIYRSFCLMLLFIVVSANSFAELESNEYNIKAMFILNFMKYVEWPSESKTEIFKIGIAGESGIYNALQTMTSERHENVKIRIEKVNPDSIQGYQVLIIPRSENRRTEEWSKKFQGKGILIISEDCKNNNNASINLININNKIRFEINNTQARLSGIKISSKLTELAISVQP